MKNTIKLLFSVAGCLLVGMIGSLFTIKEIPIWYANLNKPFFSPPNWLFGPVWTALYFMMGIAFHLVWKKNKKNKVAINNFVWQMVANLLWSVLFFGLHSPLLGLINILILWILIFRTIKSFYPISKISAYLLYPYMVWVSFASILNASVWCLNR